MGLISAVGLVLHPARDCTAAMDTITTWAAARGVHVLGLDGEIDRISGEVDHIVTLLAGKDVSARFHVDANLGYALLGRPGGGFNHNWLPTGTLTDSLTPKWQLAMEFSGATRANVRTPAVTQNLWAVSYTLRPRLVLDSAVEFRVTGNVPRVIYLGGFTYSIADLYHHRR